MFTLCPFCDKKGEYFLFWSGKVFPNRSSVFYSRMAKGGSLLVFYVGYILDDKNTLCHGCYLNRIIGLIQNLQVLWIVFIASHVPCHKFLEDVHEDPMQNPSQLAGSCTTVRIDLLRRPDAQQYL
jgi:hypothetical protein